MRIVRNGRHGFARAGTLLGLVALTSLWLAPAGRAVTSGPVKVVAAPNGQGTGCTTKRPCSLVAAQQLARRYAGKATVEVTLLGGTYQLGHPLQFGPADSGTASDPVVYEAAAGATPVLSGGVQVTDWRLADPATGLWEAPVQGGIMSRELYVNGDRAPRTSGAPSGVWRQTPTGYFTTDSSMASWRNPSSLELVFTEGNGMWTEPRCDVASVGPTAGGTAITVREPCWSNIHEPDAPTTNDPTEAYVDTPVGGFEGIYPTTNPSLIENAYELLSAPGQWYLDRSAHTIYYRAHSGENPNNDSIVLPVAQSLVEGAGALGSPVHDLRLSGITFAYTTWAQPSSDDGFAEMQANVTLTGTNASGTVPGSTIPPKGTCQYTRPRGTCPFAAWTKEPAAVTFHAAHDVTISGDKFTHLGAAGLDLDYGSQDDVVQGNEVTDTSGNGIQLGNTNDPEPIGGDPREINQGNTIADNWVHDIAAEYHGGVAVWVGYTRGTKIVHNEIDRTPYTAISFGWGGWRTDTLHTDNPSIVGDNTIADNLIFDYLTTLPDGGAIYTNGVQGPPDPAGPAGDPFLTSSTSPQLMKRGLLISGNVALVATWSEFAYYTDAAADYVTLRGNVEYQNHALATGGCRTIGHILVDDNYWAQPLDGHGGYPCPPAPVDVVVTDHHTIPDHPGPGDVPGTILRGAGLEPPFRYLVTSRAPIVTGVGPGGPDYAAGPPTSDVLVSGSGFGPGATVYFGPPGPSTAASHVDVLSANYLVATPPAGANPGTVDVIVRTSAGTSPTTSADQYTLLG